VSSRWVTPGRLNRCKFGFPGPKAEGEGFEPSVDRKAHNGFRDRADPAAMPHYNWSLHPGGMQGGMNLGCPDCATHRQRSATVLLASGAALSAANPGSPPTRECRNHAIAIATGLEVHSVAELTPAEVG
jgi:hypothetical protein